MLTPRSALSILALTLAAPSASAQIAPVEPPRMRKADPGATATDPGAPPTPGAAAESPWSFLSPERPMLAGPLAKVKFGQRLNTAKARTRGFRKENKTTLIGKVDNSVIRIEAPHGRVFRVVMYLDKTKATQELEKLYGKTDAIRSGQGKIRRWLDTQAFVRATLRELKDPKFRGYDELVLEPFIPLATLVGEGPGPFGFETPLPLLGAKRAQVRKAYGAVEWQKKGKVTPRVYLPATAFSPTFHTVELQLETKRVVSYSVHFSYAQFLGNKDAILKSFEKKLGRSVYDKNAATNVTTYKFPSAPGVELVMNPLLKRYTLRVSTPR